MTLIIINTVVIIVLFLANIWFNIHETKYRVQEIINGLGEKYYYPQYKKYIFWTTFKNQVIGEELYSEVWFESYEEAKKYIDEEKEQIEESEKRKLVISKRNLTV